MTTSNLSPLVIPPDLVAAIRAMADEEQRPVADVLRDIIKLGLESLRTQRMLSA